jgi:hypothetical protein
MVAALDRVYRISPEACRRRVELNFSVERMADDYLAAYELILEASRVRRGRTWRVLRRPSKILPARAGARVT